MKYKIFISYSRKDSGKVEAIKKEIEQATGVECWMDMEGISYDSPDFVDVIVKAIDNARVFLFMLSEHSQKSRIARGEITLAQKKNKHISIKNIDKCEMTDNFTVLYSQNNLCDYSEENQKKKLFHEIRKWLGLEDFNSGVFYQKGNITQDTFLEVAEQLYKRKAYAEAYNIFHSLSEEGNAIALYYLGIMSIYGEGTEIDANEGVGLLKKASEKCNVEAQYTLGQIYEKGLHGIPQDLHESLSWYEKAAAQNHHLSHLGVIRLNRPPYDTSTISTYNKGKELLERKEYSEAMRFFLCAAEKEHTPSMREIASMYEIGLVTNRSYRQTFEWLNKAIMLGDSEAEYISKELKFELTGQYW
ncbi:Sel1 repeat-containing protein [Prevotella communis]|uniref:Sel1 repeat-containing protein n=1 Tax=Prevotella communis TaxID=2913614 RepID=A0A1G8B034_9BACT|nr:toll/interleukin-1 receptor domain-containing protein [Prevotella communis]SDH26649.1 Sel1 repeat-containing protein [Prevotella communis]